MFFLQIVLGRNFFPSAIQWSPGAVCHCSRQLCGQLEDGLETSLLQGLRQHQMAALRMCQECSAALLFLGNQSDEELRISARRRNVLDCGANMFSAEIPAQTIPLANFWVSCRNLFVVAVWMQMKQCRNNCLLFRRGKTQARVHNRLLLLLSFQQRISCFRCLGQGEPFGGVVVLSLRELLSLNRFQRVWNESGKRITGWSSCRCCKIAVKNGE